MRSRWRGPTRRDWGSQLRLSWATCWTGRVSFDAVLANLPYVADGAALAPEIALYEPADALFAGPDGLDVIRRLCRDVAGVSVVALEIGFDQADAVVGAGAGRRLYVGGAPARPRRARARDRRAPVSDAEAFDRCMSVGGVAVFPADTVYGLACDPDNKVAVQRLYTLKRRAYGKPSAVMFFDVELAFGGAAGAGSADARGAVAADAGCGERAAAQPGGAVPAGVRRRPVDARVARAGGAAAGGRALAGAAVERQPRGRPGRAPLEEVPELDPPRGRPRDRRRGAARDAVDGRRPAALRGARAHGRWCGRVR